MNVIKNVMDEQQQEAVEPGKPDYITSDSGAASGEFENKRDPEDQAEHERLAVENILKAEKERDEQLLSGDTLTEGEIGSWDDEESSDDTHAAA